MKRDNRHAERQPLQIGIERDLGIETAVWTMPSWEDVPGGRLARLDVASPGAAALRVAVSAAGLPDGAHLRYAGSLDPEDVLGVGVAELRDQTDALGRYWTSTTSGDRQRLEWFVPDEAANILAPPHVAGVSHLFVDPHEPHARRKALGDAASCNADVACHVGTLGPRFEEAKNAVAHYVFQGCAQHATPSSIARVASWRPGTTTSWRCRRSPSWRAGALGAIQVERNELRTILVSV